MKTLTTLFILSCFISLNAQTTFAPKHVISNLADSGYYVIAADVDGDGDPDVITSNEQGDSIVWHENTGGGTFGLQPLSPQQVISNTVNSPKGIHATDLDGDGDVDLIAAVSQDDAVVWFENLGGGIFGPALNLSGPLGTPTSTEGAWGVHAADLDFDGDKDIVAASLYDSKIGWFENLGGGLFGPQQVISSNVSGAQSVYPTDVDGDGDVDLLATTWQADGIVWFENLGSSGTNGGIFGPLQTLVSNIGQAGGDVHGADMDGDGDADVLAITGDDFALYENVGAGNGTNGGPFALQQVIGSSYGAKSIHPTDLDGDGDLDVLVAARSNDTVGWYENHGSLIFGPLQVISNSILKIYCAYAEDLDGDGDEDVLSISNEDGYGEVCWHENLLPQTLNYPGSGTDLVLEVGVNGGAVTYPDIHPVSQGDHLLIHFWSPMGLYHFTPPLLVAQAFSTGSTPIGPVLFPEVHIGTGALAPYPAVVIYDGGVLGFTPALPPAGYALAVLVPPGMSPGSIMLQGFCLAPNPNNPYFTTTDAHEIQIQ